MYLRIFSSVLALTALTACEATQSPEPEGDSVECRVGAGSEMSAVCTLEWVGEPWASEFLIHHPDGGFRRFFLNEDAGGVVLKDGAEPLEMDSSSPTGTWQFSVGEDRYVMPTPPASGV